jgi:hypothetical protein
MGGEVGTNIQKIFRRPPQRLRHGVDPFPGFLWETENADDAYSGSIA